MADTSETRSPLKITISDPLGSLTRKERTYLLGVSLAGIVVATTGVIPSEISNLCIKFDRADRTAFLSVLAAVTVYYLFAFVLYGFTDFLTWTFAFHSAALEGAQQFVTQARKAEAEIDKGIVLQLGLDDRAEQVSRGIVKGFPAFRGKTVLPVALVRALFEFFVPVAVGVYAVVALIRAM